MDLSSQDLIDLSDIDADVNTAGNQAFHSVASFNGFSGAAGELMITKTASGELDTYMMEGDITGDGHADFVIEVHAYTSLGYVL
jgi:hypothetical protein